MNWTITVRPTTAALNNWSWTAVRDDQENVISGSGHATSAAAIAAAQQEAQEFEDGQGVIDSNTFSQAFEPVLP